MRCWMKLRKHYWLPQGSYLVTGGGWKQEMHCGRCYDRKWRWLR